MSANWPVLLVGLISTTQLHLAKALERQGIEVFDMLKARLGRTGERFESQSRKPWIYLVGLLLNHTTFLYHMAIAPLGGTTALYTGMYGFGLLVLLAYSVRVLGERLTRGELIGALAIFLGTLIIGIEGIFRPRLDMAALPLVPTLIGVGLMLIVCLGLLLAGLRNGSSAHIGLSFGLAAGTCGSLDPFLKGLGQTAGGGGGVLPSVWTGWLVLAFSFLIGEAAVLVTQWGFYRRARANQLVPAYNCAYIGVPVALQATLLPGYALYYSTLAGLGLVMTGFLLIRGRGRHAPATVEAA